MVQIILICAVCVLALAGGVLAWWVDNGGTFKRDNDNGNNETEKNETQKNDSPKNKSTKNNKIK